MSSVPRSSVRIRPLPTTKIRLPNPNAVRDPLAYPDPEPPALLAALQQPEWQGHPELKPAQLRLRRAPGLVTWSETADLRFALAQVAVGNAFVLQAGDCAESLYESTPAHVQRRVGLLGALGDALAVGTGSRVVRVGRMGGQFAKPRSQPTEDVDGVELPSFRGHMINSELPTLEDRRHDPGRMLNCYQASRKVMAELLDHRRRDRMEGPWASHEALVLDYEDSLIRQEPRFGSRYLASTHLPWIGERTRQPNAPHMRMMAGVNNPVGCKLGPTTRVDDVLRVCATLDPHREPGRLVLIVRMGLARVTEALPSLLSAVRRAGHPVVWLSDPMHGNTVRARNGMKTRFVADMTAEAVAFRALVERAGMHAGGIHLEVAASPVSECVGGADYGEEELTGPYTTLCDPRLNREQALELIDAWAAA
jgi:3-deoxy-7-phosphoheptulonate synthase